MSDDLFKGTVLYVLGTLFLYQAPLEDFSVHSIVALLMYAWIMGLMSYFFWRSKKKDEEQTNGGK